MRTTLAGLALALVAVVGSNAQAQQNTNANTNRNTNANTNANANNNRDAGKQETVRGVIAGVTVAGETAIDYATHRAAIAEMTYLTVVGSPVRDSASRDREQGNARNADRNEKNLDNNSADGNNRRRHNVYVIWLTPKTEFRDATAHEGNANAGNNDRNQREAQGKSVALDTLEVGDTVRVTFNRREYSQSGGQNQNQNQAQANRHGRHRTYFGDATAVTILAEPGRQRDGNRETSNDRDRDRDGNRDQQRSNENKDNK